jgi:hypothetical protein
MEHKILQVCIIFIFALIYLQYLLGCVLSLGGFQIICKLSASIYITECDDTVSSINKIFLNQIIDAGMPQFDFDSVLNEACLQVTYVNEI